MASETERDEMEKLEARMMTTECDRLIAELDDDGVTQGTCRLCAEAFDKVDLTPAQRDSLASALVGFARRVAERDWRLLGAAVWALGRSCSTVHRQGLAETYSRLAEQLGFAGYAVYQYLVACQAAGLVAWR